MDTKNLPGGYAGKILRVDLTTGDIWTEEIDPDFAREYVGGAALGAKILWDEVPKEVDWDHPDNRLIMATGPLAGTPVWGNGTLNVVTRGAMTNGATSTQANGFFGVNLKYSGYDAIVFQGQSSKWVYLHVQDDDVELRDASHLMGKDTWDLQDSLYQEYGLSGHQLSVYGIGPAGEHEVRFAAIEGDYGHVASKNGCGCVMGNKKVKCVAIVRGSKGIKVHDTAGVTQAAEVMSYDLQNNPVLRQRYLYGTLGGPMTNYRMGAVPIRNYETNIFPTPDTHHEWEAPALRERFSHRGHQCGACGMHHCHMNVVNKGPNKGTLVDEPESEGYNSCGPQLGVLDPTDTAWLNTQVDKAGVDVNEWGWVCGWVMECYAKGYITKEDLGFDLNWGDIEGINRLLQMTANREGFGDILAEGVKRAAESLGSPALECAVFTGKGNTPRGHDHRGRWSELFSGVVGSIGTIETSPLAHPEEFGVSPIANAFDPEEVAVSLGLALGRRHFEDSLGACNFTLGTTVTLICGALSAVTGWNYTKEEAMRLGQRTSALFRAFSARCGHTPDMEWPSLRYGSTPKDGPAVGQSVLQNWEVMHQKYYEVTGLDYQTGNHLPHVLKQLGLDYVHDEVWGSSVS
ncbi:MAG: hypothetical protein FI727_05565 [SAR202 cluster bacterium]|nr:hypothetical protein [SAR202 cluster bacterium]|tara:strand:+ start:18821 stop:20707 length:1887 start_codon:yes stop_codon:yes gene_type:complete